MLQKYALFSNLGTKCGKNSRISVQLAEK